MRYVLGALVLVTTACGTGPTAADGSCVAAVVVDDLT